MNRVKKWLIGILILIVAISSILALLGIFSFGPGDEWWGEGPSTLRTLGIIGLAVATIAVFSIVVSWAKKRAKVSKKERGEKMPHDVVFESSEQSSSKLTSHVTEGPYSILISRSNVIAILLFAILACYIGANFLFKGVTRSVKWEYRIVAIQDVTFEYGMKALGDEGWELAFARRAMSDDKGIYECIFKRPK